jgi:hypothetical protein
MKLGLKILDFFNTLAYTVGNSVIKWVKVGGPDTPVIFETRE